MLRLSSLNPKNMNDQWTMFRTYVWQMSYEFINLIRCGKRSIQSFPYPLSPPPVITPGKGGTIKSQVNESIVIYRLPVLMGFYGYLKFLTTFLLRPVQNHNNITYKQSKDLYRTNLWSHLPYPFAPDPIHTSMHGTHHPWRTTQNSDNTKCSLPIYTCKINAI